jgi:hypothetical protein
MEGSHGGEDVGVGVLGCNAVWTGRYQSFVVLGGLVVSILAF